MAGRLYLFAGGGTGGHLFPGIAVADALIEREPDARILFAGSDRPIEQDILSKTPFEHQVLPSLSVAGAIRRPLRFVVRSGIALKHALRLIKSERPCVVIGCGGFVSAAPIYAARQIGVPFVLLEQNVIPGRATRLLGRLGGTVCLSFEQTAAHLPRSARSVVTGNPVRKDIAELARHVMREGEAPAEPQKGCDGATAASSTGASPSRHKPTLLVLGGSQGATSINDRLVEFVRRRSDLLRDWHIIHQTGTAGVERVRAAYAAHQIDAQTAAFFDQPAQLYERASIVVSRAGGTSLAEIACAGLPAVLLPYPHATDDHQRHNALPFLHANAAYVVDEKQPHTEDADGFEKALTILISDPEHRRLMATNMHQLARPDAVARVADVVRSALS